MESKREHLNTHINLKITNKLFQSIDTLRALHLTEHKILLSRSEMIRRLLMVGIESISENRES